MSVSAFNCASLARRQKMLGLDQLRGDALNTVALLGVSGSINFASCSVSHLEKGRILEQV